MKKFLSKSKIVTNQSPSLLGRVGVGLLMLFALALPSCRAWRTVTTTSTYTSRNDSAQTSISIQTKTVEDYQGKKK